MLGFYFCRQCGKTHDDWMHSNKLIVCNVCKSRNSIQYNYSLHNDINEVDFIGLLMSDEIQEMIKNEDKGDNPFDLVDVRRRASDKFKEYLIKNSDDYLKFAYYNFKNPIDVYQEFRDRDTFASRGFDILPEL